jgi:hypothetical protein
LARSAVDHNSTVKRRHTHRLCGSGCTSGHTKQTGTSNYRNRVAKSVHYQV